MAKKKTSDEKPLNLKVCKKVQKKTVKRNQSGLTCTIHYSRNKTDSKIRPLSESSFDTITDVVKFRQSQEKETDRLDEICKQVPKQYYPHIYGVHRWCFNNFINISRLRKRKDHPDDDDARTSRPSKRRRSSRCPPTDARNNPSTSLLLPDNKCLICDEGRKWKKGKEESLTKCVTKSAEESIKNAAEKDPDGDVFRRVNGVDLVAREAHYHPSCRRDFTRKESRNAKADEDSQSKQEKVAHSKAFEYIASYVKDSIISHCNVERMSMLREKYLLYMLEQFPDFYNPDYRTYKIKAKLVKHFGAKLQFWQPNYMSELVYSREVAKGHAVSSAFEAAASESRRLEEAAMILRRVIQSGRSDSQDMPWPPSAGFLQTDAIKPPESLLNFVSYLIGNRTSTESSVKKQRLASSLAQDICYATTNGQWMMPKHLLLGMSLRHITGSAKVITLINRFGHCASYSRMLELDTALCNSITDTEEVIPAAISPGRNSVTHLCWDNFDLMEETPSGADTTHTAHGIIIQEISNDAVGDNSTDPPAQHDSVPKTKARSVQHQQQEIEPCFMKGKAEPNLTLTVTKAPCPASLQKAESSDALWVCSRAVKPEDVQKVPSWAGWVSITEGYSEDHKQSTVEYMPPVFSPVTENATVQHILKVSQNASRQVNQPYTIVTFDLAVAKKAYALLWERPNLFKDVLVRMGGFHLVCTYMGALGKSIRGSGFEEILVQSGVCVSGSIDRVVAGKHYNRALRAHKIVLEALERLLMKKVEELHEDVWNDEARRMLTRVAESPCKATVEEALTNDSCLAGLAKVLHFKEQARQGDHGKTTQFWIQYMDRVHLIMQFQRATKQNDLDLHLACLQRMCSLFFAYDHPNYARYTTVYLLSLLNLPETHPGAEDLLRQNGFSVSRSDVPSSRNAVDITIEQTINRHAKSNGGIIGFSRCQASYYRWCMTRHARASYVQATMEMADMDNTELMSHKNLRPSSIRHSEEETSNMVDSISSFINPFDVECQDVLYCLSSGVPVPSDIAEDLLHADKTGEEAHASFVDERLANNMKSFHSPIKKIKLKTFNNLAKSRKVSSKSKKTKEIRAERNVFGQLILLAIEHNLSLEKVLCFPLGPVPWALATADGIPAKTDKAKLLHELEGDHTTDRPPLDSVIYIVDGNALYQIQKSLPSTFEELAASLFNQLPKSSRLDFVTDTYLKGSIKSIERSRRGSGKAHLIKGPKTKVPRDWKGFLSNDENKKQLTAFLLQEWKGSKYAAKLYSRQIMFVCEDKTFKLESSDGEVTSCQEVPELCSSQEEADTKMILHCLHHAAESPDGTTIIIQSPDTDVFVLLLYFESLQNFSQSVLFETGSGNKHRIIDVKKAAEAQGEEVCLALPGFHAFTGCDSTSAFVNKGKTIPLALLKQRPEFLDTFLDLGRYVEVSEATLEKLEHFACLIYARRTNVRLINTLRHSKFVERFRSNTDAVVSSSDGSDLSLIPPCRDSLQMHIRRANFQALIWCRADRPHQDMPNPQEHGWVYEVADGSIECEWTKGDLMPQELAEVITELDSDEDSDEDDVDNEYETMNLTDIIFDDDETEY